MKRLIIFLLLAVGAIAQTVAPVAGVYSVSGGFGGGGSGGTPGGNNTEVQVNDNGAFAGYSDFTYSAGVLSIPSIDSGNGPYAINSIAELFAPEMIDLAATTELPRGPAPFRYNYWKDLSGGVTLTDAAGTPNDGDGQSVLFVGDGTARTITIPTSFSVAQGQNITSFVVPINGAVLMTRKYVDGAWYVTGEPIPSATALANLNTANGVGFVVTGNGDPITTGVKAAYVKAPFSGTLVGWTIIASPSGSVTVDILRSANGGGLPSASIVGGGGTKPAISGGTQNSSTSFTGWTSTAVAALDNFTVEVTATDGVVEYVNLVLYYR